VTAYYNEHDRFAAAWLRELIADGLIAAGDVDERSILDVPADDLRGYTQCHFFAGIGGWSYALRLAGWPDDREVWTGSCPCQPLSSAGQQKGHADERHLWPAFYELIAECRPSTVFGEQVASKLGREWLCGIRTDLEDARYVVGAADLCAAGAGAPHIRQRLFWVADTDQSGGQRTTQRQPVGSTDGRHNIGGSGPNGGWVGHADSERQPAEITRVRQGAREPVARRGTASGLADANGDGAQRLTGNDGEAAGLSEGQRAEHGPALLERGGADGGVEYPESKRRNGGEDPPGQNGGCSPQNTSPWSNATLIPCADGKARVIEPSIFPLAHGFPNRVGVLRGAGNAIVPQIAAAFVRATGV